MSGSAACTALTRSSHRTERRLQADRILDVGRVHQLKRRRHATDLLDGGHYRLHLVQRARQACREKRRQTSEALHSATSAPPLRPGCIERGSERRPTGSRQNFAVKRLHFV